VPTQSDTYFDESNFSENSSGSLASESHDRCHISKLKDALLLRDPKLIIKLTLTGLGIKISIAQKAQIGD
jgi:hypothetical protein